MPRTARAIGPTSNRPGAILSSHGVGGSRGEAQARLFRLLRKSSPLVQRPAAGERYGSYARTVISRVTLAQRVADFYKNFWPPKVAKNKDLTRHVGNRFQITSIRGLRGKRLNKGSELFTLPEK